MATSCASNVMVMAARRVGVGHHQKIISQPQHHSRGIITPSYKHVKGTFQSKHANNMSAAFVTLSLPEQRRIYSNYNPPTINNLSSTLLRRRYRSSSTKVNDADIGEFYANPESFPDFASLGITSSTLLKRLSKPLNLKRPSAIQAAIFDTVSRGDCDVIVGAETGESCLDFVEVGFVIILLIRCVHSFFHCMLILFT